MSSVSKSISPDGSERSFSRITWNGRPAVRIEPSKGREGLREACSFFCIGRHLFDKGIPVPEIYFFERNSGILVVEDLGNVMLFDRVRGLKKQGRATEIKETYVKVLDLLLLMQTRGGAGFDTKWCWQTRVYDSKLALEKEVGYFLQAFVRDYMNFEPGPKVLVELEALASKVDRFDCEAFFLHRDFQSRNLLVRNGCRFGIVDFQAGRLGPLCYDVASLLNDPYVALDLPLRLELFDHYLTRLEECGLVQEADEIKRQWPVLSLLRLMQALGAFAFLTKRKGKVFFKSYIRPALEDVIWFSKKHGELNLVSTTKMCQRLFDDVPVEE